MTSWEAESPLEPVFEQLGQRPLTEGAERAEKKNYAQQLSNQLAVLIANRLRSFALLARARITPDADGRRQEFTLGTKSDAKRVDVAVWDETAGLLLGVSIKTITSKDAKSLRYTKNMKARDFELRDEADVLHRRQPFAYLVALAFLPWDASYDARGPGAQSSFAHAVFTYRKRAGRRHPDEARYDLFEKVFIGLFTDDGTVAFADVDDAPPRNQPPRADRMLSLGQLTDAVVAAMLERNISVADIERYSPDDPNWSPPSDGQKPVLHREVTDEADA